MRLVCGVATVVLLLGLAAALSPMSGAYAEGDKPAIEKADDYDPVINPADFEDGGGNPLPIDNQYMPLVPGTSLMYEGETEDGLEEVLEEVTYDTKVILGVTCTVVRAREWLEGILTEDTLDWYAQDQWGNVWYFGEYSEAYENGDVSTEGSWEAGVDGAKPGIIMLADPQPGDAYRQEYYEDEAEDMGKVLRLNASVSVAYGDFDDCLVTKEWTPLEPGEVEHKFHAPGVGLVLIRELQGGPVVFELVDVVAP